MKGAWKLAIGLVVGIVLVYLGFFGYVFAVAQQTAKVDGGNPQVVFAELVEQEKNSLVEKGQFFWPKWPKIEPEVTLIPIEVFLTATPDVTVTPTPTEKVWSTPTPGPVSTQDSYGFFRDCEPDTVNPYICVCKDYAFTIHIERVNCDQTLCEATITFTSEYADTMWVDYFDSETSVEFHNGEVVMLPSLDLFNWGISSGKPFFVTTLTPQP